jgi:hypothetical protein
MSLTAILAAIASLGTIVGGIVYIFKYSTWALTTPPAQTDNQIDQQAETDLTKSEETGRPQ